MKLNIKIFPLLIIISLLIFVINSNPYLSPNDDIAFQLTILSNNPFIGLSPESISQGRFNPSGGLLFNIALLSPSVKFLFIISTFQIILTILFFYAVINRILENEYTSTLVVLFLILTPPFAMAWMRLSLGERDAMLFISAFIYFIINQRISPYFRIPILIFIVNFIIYSKEPYGICFLIFSFVNILDWIKNKRINDKIINIIVVISSLVFYIIYYELTKNNLEAPYNKHSDYNLFYKNIVNYFTFDSLIFLVFIPVFIYSAFLFIKKKRAIYYPYDGLFCAGISYGLIYLSLNIYQPYYLGPAYILTIPSIIFYFKNNLIKFSFFKKFFYIYLFFYLLFILPTGIHYLSRQYYLPLNSNLTYQFLGNSIKNDNSKGIRPTIFIDGRYPNNGLGEYHLFEVFLSIQGITDKNYDLASNLEPTLDLPREIVNWKINDFRIYNQKNIINVEVGDYLIITPDDMRLIDDSYLNSLGLKYEKIFETRSTFFIPLYNPKIFFKYFCLKFCSEEFISEFINSRNIKNSPDFIIYKRIN